MAEKWTNFKSWLGGSYAETASLLNRNAQPDNTKTIPEDEALSAQIAAIKGEIRRMGMRLPLTYRAQLQDDIRRVETLMAKRVKRNSPKLDAALTDAVTRLNVSVTHLLNTKE